MADFYDKPVRGRWQHRDHPSAIHIGEICFRRAGWRQDYPGVVAQYREDRLFRSHHLKVHDDGFWSIDHVDLVNPDRGPLAAFAHLVVDALPVWLAEFAGQVIAAIQEGVMALDQGINKLLERAGFPALAFEG